ncbi:hypothetical protein LZ017_03765 [Pelomonas sp. CA6]|uniref:HD-GYP domain-containing protein n=1 Tax=Pelomonas sp. CA6 TaxID=2907999 RepID=UPI001F4B0B70|nr:hypothetical protein [Pelomonas sp. CA6]MCH7342494.1 hypothetical protein [Pelomonas sp. CA6]
MDLVHLPPHSLRLGQVLSFSVRDAQGKLLFAAGQVLSDTPQVRELIQSGGWVAAHETREYQRALAHKMDTLMHQGAPLAKIVQAEAEFRPDRPAARGIETGEAALWADLQLQTHTLLRDPARSELPGRLDELHRRLLERLDAQPDAALMLLIAEAGHDYQNYSARHGLLCLVLAELAARALDWPAAERQALGRAALTMNLAITLQQDRYAGQTELLSPAQRQQLQDHGERAAALLARQGVDDALWLNTVRLHHDAGPGALAGREPADRLARLLHRVDLYAARLSPRRSRPALSATQAARAIHLDELQQSDEAGAALLSAVGLYPPGSLVRLVSGEQGMVLRRGPRPNEPRVAALLGKSGTPLSDPVPRDTRQSAHAVAASLAPHELKLRLNYDKLLKAARSA